MYIISYFVSRSGWNSSEIPHYGYSDQDQLTMITTRQNMIHEKLRILDSIEQNMMRLDYHSVDGQYDPIHKDQFIEIGIATNYFYTTFISTDNDLDAGFIDGINGILNDLREANKINIVTLNTNDITRADDRVGIVILDLLSSILVRRMIVLHWFRALIGLEVSIDDIMGIVVGYGNRFDIFDHRHIIPGNDDEYKFIKLRRINLR